MAISERNVKNKRDAKGKLTGRSGKVYDVNIKYKSGDRFKTYSKKGLLTYKDAQEYEAEMRRRLGNPSYVPTTAVKRKLTVAEYMGKWIEEYSRANLRPSTTTSYRSMIRSHINPYLGNVQLCRVSPAMLDKLYADLKEEGLSPSTIRYVHRVLSVSLENARKYHYIESNPAKDIITRFGKPGKTPDPYTVDQMKKLMDGISDTQWKLIVILGGMYGLRLSEILGLRWRNVDFENQTFAVVEQLPFGQTCTAPITEMAPVKSCERELPITAATLPYFEQQRAYQMQQKQTLGTGYIENDLVIAKADGRPEHRVEVSKGFGRKLKQFGLPHIRFHDLRHSAATNMHQLTGDFFTIAQILGHSIKGIGNQLDIPVALGAVTAQYIGERTERKELVLSIYHNAVFESSTQ
nr:site-specific integrase [uncultured Oscillibacter sp.]